MTHEELLQACVANELWDALTESVEKLHDGVPDDPMFSPANILEVWTRDGALHALAELERDHAATATPDRVVPLLALCTTPNTADIRDRLLTLLAHTP